ncbi:hypothetical protein AN639_10845 [Candidatus Epulonipiscium fishelsonii]|uniref:Uncharacterized protein n=1 Tax=Candidatus Epulonipiscium fishelsonii TaxID=77094 RepID=A0ACC8XEI8_9FIRM|nr:hypothetical protein AN396_03645 [Epulopiscium sp. SCG-B11WGA-EpuloA1]ONI43229.1 hypothetical protein AN639_10845 [Epulopiscium sp. SCG-B05WGA-EpuloA1]
MQMINKLIEAMEEIETNTKHEGYFYKVKDILIITVCGLLCSLKDINYISEWSLAKPTRQMLKEEFGIEKVPCRAQFYNI